MKKHPLKALFWPDFRGNFTESVSIMMAKNSANRLGFNGMGKKSLKMGLDGN